MMFNEGGLVADLANIGVDYGSLVLDPMWETAVSMMSGPEWMQRDCLARAKRHAFVKDYSWAVPTAEAIELMMGHMPIVEVGAGTGFWASLLQAAGGDILAFDLHPPGLGHNGFHSLMMHTEVHYGGAPIAALHPDRTLFLCWPPYSNRMAANALRQYHGDTLIYVGEYDGCTADKRFFNQLARDWVEIETIEISQWPGIHDQLGVYRRKGGDNG